METFALIGILFGSFLLGVVFVYRLTEVPRKPLGHSSKYSTSPHGYWFELRGDNLYCCAHGFERCIANDVKRWEYLYNDLGIRSDVGIILNRNQGVILFELRSLRSYDEVTYEEYQDIVRTYSSTPKVRYEIPPLP
jgi:hypothetical protein